MKKNELQGKTALVCGASRGIGLAAAHALAAKGCRVVLMARHEPELQKALRQLQKAYPNEHHLIVGDASNPLSLSKAVHHWVTAHGTIHILVNNSGGPPRGPYMTLPQKHSRRHLPNIYWQRMNWAYV